MNGFQQLSVNIEKPAMHPMPERITHRGAMVTTDEEKAIFAALKIYGTMKFSGDQARRIVEHAYDPSIAYDAARWLAYAAHERDGIEALHDLPSFVVDLDSYGLPRPENGMPDGARKILSNVRFAVSLFLKGLPS